MQIEFTHHARVRAKQRNIKTEQITNAIKEPIIKSLENETENKISFYGSYKAHLCLRVVTIVKDETIIVITAHPVAKKELSKITSFIEQS